MQPALLDVVQNETVPASAATPAAAATHVTTDARRSARLIRGSSPPDRRTLARPADRVRNADEDRGMRQASPRVAGEEARRGDEATGPLRRGDAELVRRKRGRGGEIGRAHV